MQLTSVAQFALALCAQIPLADFESVESQSGYNIAAMHHGVEAPQVEDILDELYSSDPAKFSALLDPSSAPISFAKHSNWERVGTHPDFPNYQVRVKDPSKLGADSVKQWSGYVDILDEDKHFFFWLFESRNDPANDPVVLWLNGGPGCSSSTGQFFELGPTSINENLTLTHNPYAWNNNATVIFLDQPVNVGYSYSENRVRDSTLAGKDVYSFLSVFFHEFQEYSGLPFHISGESYAGHYLPTIGYEIIQHEDRNFNLTSVLIGNGYTDPLNQAQSSIDMACGLGGYPSVLEPEVCAEQYTKLPRCLELMNSCYSNSNPLVCFGAGSYCEALTAPYYETGRNSYDMRDVCYDSCYPQTTWIEKYLNQTHVQEALGAEAVNYEGCSGSVFSDFLYAGDEGIPTHRQVAALLEYGIPVLIYVGDKDYNCNWLGNRAWTDHLVWSQQTEFADATVLPWHVNGKQAGSTKTAGPFTFLRIFDAGHMVPFNKPQEALTMLNEWINGRGFH